jgi:2-iminobutanoate/2-iminopropanoate deaminase
MLINTTPTLALPLKGEERGSPSPSGAKVGMGVVLSAEMFMTRVFAIVLLVVAGAVQAKECYTPDARSKERAFSRAVITEGGKAVWLGGQTASDPTANFETQVRDVFASLDKTIRAVGGSGLRDMVTMTVFINDVRLGDQFVKIRQEVFKECFPASALITVSGFARPGLLVEVQGIAVIGSK